MTKYVCFIPSKQRKERKLQAKTLYAEDKEKAKLYCKGKYGREPYEILTIEELEKKVKEHENNTTNEQ